MAARYRREGFFFLLFLLLNPVLLMARSTIRVDEAKSRLALNDHTSILKLAVVSDFTNEVSVHVDVEVLDTDDTIIERVSQDSVLKQRSQQLDIPLVESFSRTNSRDVNPLWRRIRYRVSVVKSGQSVAQAAGIVSVSELGAEPFVLKVAAPSFALGGTRCRLHVFTQRAGSVRPVGNVEITGTLTIAHDGGEVVLKSRGRSNSSGHATLDFDIPSNLENPDVTFKVQATSGTFVKELSDEIDFNSRTQVVLSTDKPLYQPGQHLRIRALLFDTSKRALAKVPVQVEIHDPEFSTVHRTESMTSRFGEVDTDWLIPENVRLGNYTVEVTPAASSESTSQSVRISRYDLPGFTITPKPDRAYYLPDQNSNVEIRADYLFGQPVKRGHARIIREEGRHWNYREQKWEAEEAVVAEGDLNSEGRFTAILDLQKEHDPFASQYYQRYSDIQFAVYVTDSTTNKTEQRRFELRLSREPIHIYVSENNNAKGLPLEFYLSTFYADGTPAKSRVGIYELPASAAGIRGRDIRDGGSLLRVIHTNKYGVAKVTGLRASSPVLLFAADDGTGKGGRYNETLWLRDSNIRVSTNKILYRTGEPIEVQLESTFTSGPVVLEIMREEKVLHSQVVQLGKGKAFSVIPYMAEFKDDITVNAFYAGSHDDARTSGSRRIAYPRNRELQIDARFNRTAYGPGDEASVAFRIRTPDGLPKPSLLGLVVLDKAIEERARTDDEFGQRGWFCNRCYSWLGSEVAAGLSRSDLDRVDLTAPVSEDLETAAEALLNAGGPYNPFYSDIIEEDDIEPEEAFRGSIERQLDRFTASLNDQFHKDWRHPVDETSLRDLLSTSGLNFDAIRDPWGNPYRPAFSLDRGFDILELSSAGPDKRFGTPDDFRVLRLKWGYFDRYGLILNDAVRNYRERTGNFIRDSATLKTELLLARENLDSWEDRWGRPYRVDFKIAGTQLVTTVWSGGPNRAFESIGVEVSDDFRIWTVGLDYTLDVRNALDRIVDKFYRDAQSFPETRDQFEEAVRRDGAPESVLLDPWGHRYYPTFKTDYYYSDQTRVVTYREYLRENSQGTSRIPVTSKIQFLVLRSAGPDGIEGTSDDFDVARVFRTLAQQSAQDPAPVPQPAAPILQGANGAIKGSIFDTTGALIPGVSIQAKSADRRMFDVVSDNSGAYILRNLAPGFYEVSISLPGFATRIIQEVPVQPSSVTELNVTLMIASNAQSVEVSLSSLPLLTTSASTVSLQADRRGLPGTPSTPFSTPRLRDYFPETLLWQPALETDRSGRAQVKFKLADNITTWKMAAVVSTIDGQIGMLEKELVSFQPFFLEHDPPKILTQGDEIALPVVIRSYLDKDQQVEVTMQPERWFTPLDGATKNANIKAGESMRQSFAFKAVIAAKDAKQRVTARGSQKGDAIERSVTVLPDGEEITRVTSDVLDKELVHSIVVPPEAIPNTMHAEVKIYPNLTSHVVDGIEGILQRPYGCAEQTISSTYPSLMLLRYYDQAGRSSPALAAKARRYLQAGLDRLRGFQTAAGAFSYWQHGSPDIAITAYALRFLNDASELVAVDENILQNAYAWLERSQEANGAWGSNRVLTALIVRTLSEPRLRETLKGRRRVDARDAVAGAIAYLGKQTDNFEEPYTLASLAIAASNLGNGELLNDAVTRLARMAHTERNGVYWDLQTNTPFYGWGFAGRLETTALVVRAFSAAQKKVAIDSGALLNQGLLFLLRSKDRFGVWHSTQATVNALDAIISVVGKEEATTGSSSVDVAVNGRVIRSIAIPETVQPLDAITLDLSPFISNGDNPVEIRAANGMAAAVQFVETFYIPWNAAPPKAESAVRLKVQFDKTEARVGDEIVCRVETERVGFRAYGMMLAEIGLPPGAEVDRASLDEAVRSGGWSLYRYDVLPDRLIAYLWPRAGGTQFDFKFRIRYGINAQSPASRLYDYYNPDAEAKVMPVRFQVK